MRYVQGDGEILSPTLVSGYGRSKQAQKGMTMIAISATYDNDIRNWPSDIYIMSDDGQNMRCLTSAYNLRFCSRLHWLTERDVLFASSTPSEQFFVINTNNPVMRPFMRENEQKTIMQVTSDQKIFFSTHGHDWMVPVNGTLDDCIELVVDGMLVAISPDGQWIAYYKEETPGFVYLQELNTAHVHRIFMSDPANEHDADSRTVVWSPDSRYLAYEANYQELWVMRADGTQRRQVGELEYFWLNYRWSPDSTAIAFIGPAPGEGAVVSEAPLCVTAINDPTPRRLAMLCKSDHSGGAWDWMPDGRHIVYATHEHDVANLYKINIHSGEQHLLTDSGRPFAGIYDVAVSA